MQAGADCSYKPKPLPADDDAFTARRLAEEELAFNRRTMVEIYQKEGRRNPAWDDRAVAFLDAFARYFACTPDCPRARDLVPEAEALLEAGCDDPMVLYCCATAYEDAEQKERAEALLREALEGFEGSRYPGIRTAFALMRLSRLLSRAPDQQTRNDAAMMRQQAVRLFARATGDGTYRPDEMRVMLAQLRAQWDDLGLGEKRVFYETVRDTAGHPLYVEQVIGGMYEIDAAWDARGGKLAYKVSERKWQRFEEHLKKARELLVAAWRAHPEFPDAPALMIPVTAGGYAKPWETPRMWFDRAVAAQFDFGEAYHLGVECLETKRFDTGVPFWFFEAVQRIAVDMEWDDAYWKKRKTYPRLQEMFAGYAEQGLPSRRDYYRSVQAAVEWYYQHYDEARGILEELGDRFDDSVFSDWFETPAAQAKREIMLLSGASGDEMQRAERLRASGRFEEALKTYRKVAAQADEEVGKLVRDSVVALDMEREFADGDWVRFMPPPDFAGWSYRAGDWRYLPDGALEAKSWDKGFWLLCDADLGRRLEIQGEIEFVGAPEGTYNEAGLMLARTGMTPCDYVYWGASSREKYVKLTHNYWDDETKVARVEVKKRNTFLVQLWDDRIIVYLNDAPVLQLSDMEITSYGGAVTSGLSSSAVGPGLTVRYRKKKRTRHGRGIGRGAGGKGRNSDAGRTRKP